ncbi:hypothetical protein SLAVM298S_03981 [Streptomyces lavendulae subsp. lavendulae]
MNAVQDHRAVADGRIPPQERAADDPPAPDGAGDPAHGAEGPEDAEEGTPHAWDSRRDLYRHSPGFMLGHSGRIGGSLVGGDQHGVSGGQVTGDVILGGSKVEYHLGGDSEERSGEIPAAEVESLAENFVYPLARRDDTGPEEGAPAEAPEPDGPWEAGSPFALALAGLRKHRVAVLAGPATTGRRAAALMLLRAAGSAPTAPSTPRSRRAGSPRSSAKAAGTSSPTSPPPPNARCVNTMSAPSASASTPPAATSSSWSGPTPSSTAA